MPFALRPKASGNPSPSDRSYPIRADLNYWVIKDDRVLITGTGHTKTMSGRDLWFESNKCLGVGNLVELAITWPVRLDHTVPLRLFVEGRTVGVEGNSTKIEIKRHEFRTSRAPKPSGVRPSSAISSTDCFIDCVCLESAETSDQPLLGRKFLSPAPESLRR